jgi:hypothetical protein
MTIKQHGGVFGRNPSFNDVSAESLTVAGNALPDASTILVDSDIGTIASQDADSVSISGGAIDGTNIGDSTPAAGSFTTIDGSGDMNIDNNTLFVDASENRVGIGTESPTQLLEIVGDADNGATPPTLRITNTESDYGSGATLNVPHGAIEFYMQEGSQAYPAVGAAIKAMNQNANGSAHGLGFFTNNASAEPTEIARLTAYSDLDMTLGGGNIIMADGAGIDFSATAGTGTSELFDDYEEGTWTPAFAAVTVTHTDQSGSYTKIGNMVFCHGLIAVSSIDDSDTSGIQINGLPFTGTGTISIQWTKAYNLSPLATATFDSSMPVAAPANGTAVQPRRVNAAASSHTGSRYVDLVNASGQIQFFIAYQAA